MARDDVRRLTPRAARVELVGDVGRRPMLHGAVGDLPVPVPIVEVRRRKVRRRGLGVARIGEPFVNQRGVLEALDPTERRVEPAVAGVLLIAHGGLGNVGDVVGGLTGVVAAAAEQRQRAGKQQAAKEGLVHVAPRKQLARLRQRRRKIERRRPADRSHWSLACPTRARISRDATRPSRGRHGPAPGDFTSSLSLPCRATRCRCAPNTPRRRRRAARVTSAATAASGIAGRCDRRRSAGRSVRR